MSFWKRVAVNTLGFYLVAMLIPGFYVNSWWVALGASLVLSLVKPLVQFFTFPITLFTLGLFSFVANGLAIMMTSHFIGGMYVSSLWTAVIVSILLSLFQSFVAGLIGEN